MRRLLERKRVNAHREPSPVGGEPGRKIEARAGEQDVSGPTGPLECLERPRRNRGTPRRDDGEDRRDRGDRDRRPRRTPQEATPLAGASDRPEPDRQHGHLGSTGERDRTREGREENATEKENEESGGSSEFRVGVPVARERRRENEPEDSADRDQGEREQRAEGRRDPARAPQRGEDAGRELRRRLVHPRNRLARLSPHDRDPEKKERPTAEHGERGAATLLGGGHDGERRDREQREVVKVERNGGQESDRRQVPGTFRQHERQEKEQKSRERKKRVGARFSGIDEEQRGDARQNDEPDFRGARGKSEHSDEKSERRGEGEHPRKDVARETLADRDERLLQEVEEWRPRVVAQDV
jgi:hypothetical protein